MSRLIYDPAHQLQTPTDDQQPVHSQQPSRAECKQGQDPRDPDGHIQNEWCATFSEVAVMTCLSLHACATKILPSMHVFSLQWAGFGLLRHTLAHHVINGTPQLKFHTSIMLAMVVVCCEQGLQCSRGVHWQRILLIKYACTGRQCTGSCGW